MDKYLMDSHKLFWHFDRVLDWQKTRLICPIYIEVSPVAFCNHKCIFCGLDFARGQGIQLDTETFCKRITEMGEIGVRSIMFGGEGEPLLHEDLPQFVKRTKLSGMDVSISTNATTGNYELWRKILPYLTWIRFSVNAGTAEVYAKVHNVPNSFFDKTLNSIKEAIRVKKEDKLGVTLGIQFLVIEENLGNIENAIHLFTRLGIDYFSLKPYSPHPQMIRKKKVVYTKKTIAYIKEIVSKHRSGNKTNIIFRENTMRMYMSNQNTFNHCRALPFWGYISSKGNFYTCSVFINDERFNVGNIYENDMKDILCGEKRRESIEYAEKDLLTRHECRLNCRMARINEFLEFLEDEPEHTNFI